jgi:CubicO group peptidase (beta-lactamase class C family)
VKNENCNIWTKRAAQLVVVAILLVLFGSGCKTISPKLQDKYIRPGLSQGMYSFFDKYRQLYSEMMVKDKIPGLVVTVVDRDGILWAAGFGYTDYSRKTPVTTDTMFDICSMSKPVTATAVTIAVQDGLLELDVPIVEYVPQFTVNSRFEEDPEKKITLRHLLSHTSGLARVAPIGNTREPSYGSLEEHVMSLSDTWLRHKVGGRYSYSNVGYDLVAYIVQVQSGQPFARYVEDKVFAPLHMSNCSVDPQFIKNHPNRAVGHMPFVKEVPLSVDVPHTGAGGVYASAKEMANFVKFFLNEGKVNGQTVLDESLMTSMYSNNGLSVVDYNKNYLLGHTGAGNGFFSQMYWFPEYEIGYVFLDNALNRLPSGIWTALIDENLVEKKKSLEIPWVEYPTWQPPDPNSFTRFKPEWKKYIGTYKFFHRGWKLGIPIRIALALGLTFDAAHLKVFEKDGYLYVKAMEMSNAATKSFRLDEHLPGLFFTPTGRCLDLRGPNPTWRNLRMKKVDNDTSGKFHINLVP